MRKRCKRLNTDGAYKMCAGQLREDLLSDLCASPGSTFPVNSSQGPVRHRQ